MPPDSLVEPGQLVGGEARGLLVPAVVQAVPLVELEVGGLGAAADQRVVDVVGDRVLVAVVGERVAEERLAADDVERDLVPLEGLAGLLDVGAVVARLVGHQDDQDLAVLAGSGRRSARRPRGWPASCSRCRWSRSAAS